MGRTLFSRPLTFSLCALILAFTSDLMAQDVVETVDAFDVWEIRVGGNSVLDARTIERAVYPFLGPARSVEDMQAAREAVAQAYREAGYNTALVSLPEQTVEQGIVRITVVEGVLGRARVYDADYVSGRDVLQEMESLEPGRPIEFGALQDDLAAVNRRSPDRSVTPVIRAGRNPGEIDLDLRVEDKLPLHASFDVNDRFTVDTAELRASASLSYDNLFQEFHSLSLQYTTAPERQEDSEVWALTYLWRFRESPAVLALYAVDTSSDVFAAGDLNVLGDARIYGFRYVRPMQSGTSLFHSFTLGADNKDFNEVIGDTLETPIHYTHLVANYNFGWNFERYRSSYDFGLGLGVRALGNDVQEFEDKRFNAKPNYYYLRLGTEQLIRAWKGMGLYARIGGQLSPEPLIANEQIAVGGATTVRGYLEAERLADYGGFGSLEIRSPNVGPRVGSWIDNLYFLAFYDAATLGINQALPGQPSRFDLSSTGIGLRFMTKHGVLAAVDYAHPLQDSTNVQAGDERFHFQLKWNF
ncbi:MAG: POTRA domain-containing protein [Pseudomonadota bacterium]